MIKIMWLFGRETIKKKKHFFFFYPVHKDYLEEELARLIRLEPIILLAYQMIGADLSLVISV